MKLKTSLLNFFLPVFIFIFTCLPVFADTIQGPSVVIEYQPKNKLLAEEILKRFETAKEKVTEAYKLDYKPQVSLIISENAAAFEQLTGINSTAVQAVAIAGQKTIIINTGALHFSHDELLHLLEHEISHLVLGYHIPYNPEHLPRWFNEGISQWVAEGFNELFSASYMNSLQVSFITGNVIPFDSLASSFPSQLSNEFIQAYAQSLSFIQFLIKDYGESKLTELVERLSNQAPFKEAFLQTYGMSLKQAEREWGSTGKRQYTLDYYIATNINSILYGLMAILAVFAYISVQLRNKRKKEKLLESELPSEY